MGKARETEQKSKTKESTKADPKLLEQGEMLWQMALKLAGMGPPPPNKGLTTAAFSPMQMAAFEGTNQAAGAFGLPTAQGTGLPPPETVGGFSGYSTSSLFDDMMAKVPQEYRDGMAAFFKGIQDKAATAGSSSSTAAGLPGTPTVADGDILKRVRALEKPYGNMTASQLASSSDPGASYLGRSHINSGSSPYPGK